MAMKHYKVEANWRTQSGLRAVVIKITGKHRCGYVGVPRGNSLFGMGYQRIRFVYAVDSKIKSSERIPTQGDGFLNPLTFSSRDEDKDTYPVKSDLHWFGFDTGYTQGASLGYCIYCCETLAKGLLVAHVATKENEDDL